MQNTSTHQDLLSKWLAQACNDQSPWNFGNAINTNGLVQLKMLQAIEIP